jgi:hypothetical protein
MALRQPTESITKYNEEFYKSSIGQSDYCIDSSESNDENVNN